MGRLPVLRQLKRGVLHALAAAAACLAGGLCAAPALAAWPHVVVTTADFGPGSLRYAIDYANGHPGTTISFQIPAAMSVAGVYPIKPGTPLPPLTAAATIIDGGTQTTFGGNTNPAGPEILLTGTAGVSQGLVVNAPNCHVRNLAINAFTSIGITVTGAGTRIRGCYIGTNVSGTANVPNGISGISLSQAGGCLIGGTTTALRNVISGNGSYGIYVFGPPATGNLIQGNYIGTDAAGNSAVPNGLAGVFLNDHAHGNTVGGTAAGAGNLISGNAQRGVLLSGAGTTANLVQGNLIGTIANGALPLPNGADGVTLTAGADGNTIGGTAAGAKNVISGNLVNGVRLSSHLNLVQGNHIGTNPAGNGAIENGAMGVYVTGSHANTIGGTAAGARNLISGNHQDGIRLYNVSETVVQGNYIGLNVSGTASVPNHLSGVQLTNTSFENAIGGSSDGARNVISGNGNGVTIRGAGTTGNAIARNYIGTNANGGAAVPNAVDGVVISDGASGNSIGGTEPDTGNLISGNTGVGVRITAAGNYVYGNRIGTNYAGMGPVANTEAGVHLSGAGTGCTIGGAGAAGNQISGNGGDGVVVGAASTHVYGNRIGLNASGTGPLANGGSGVRVESSVNEIGTDSLGNVISGNAQNGILFTTGNAHHNFAAGNMIGLNPAGTAVRANGGDGIAFTLGAQSNKVGGSSPARRNVISGNAFNGVRIRDGGFVNTITGNYIGTNAAGIAALANHACGVFLEGGATGPHGNFIGPGNVISGNLADGVRIKSGGADDNVVKGNLVGVTASGNAALPNSKTGVAVRADFFNVSGTVISDNVVSGNLEGGIFIHGPATDHTIQGNTVGLSRNGTAAIGNHGAGIRLDNGVEDSRVGGTLPEERNVVAANSQEGIKIETCTGIVVEGNYIGTDATGLVDRGNGSHGISLADGTEESSIGGSAASAGNVISGNGGCGLRIAAFSTQSNTVMSNLIGVDKDGDAALANLGDGVLLEAGASSNTLARNVISGNRENGVRLRNGSTAGNELYGNFIGTNAAGDAGIPNVKAGVEASQGAGPNVIGAANSGKRNRIAFNTGDGVLVRDAATHGIAIRGNEIFDNGRLGINLETSGATGLVTPNDNGDGDAGPNGLQNFPTITGAISSPNVSVSVVLSGFAASRTLYVDLYYGPSADADPSGYGQGPHYLGTKIVTTDASGHASFTYTSMGAKPGSFYAATATDSSTGNTSELSRWRTLPPVGIGG